MASITNGMSGLDARTNINYSLQKQVDVRDFDVDLSGGNSSTAGLNQAIAQAFSSQVPLYLPDGHYMVDGSDWDTTTNSLLTVPATTGYQVMPPLFVMVGQSRGVWDWLTNTYLGGVVVDSSNATGAGGTHPSLLSACAFSEIAGFDVNQWYSCAPVVSEISFILPSNASFGGLNFHNATQATVERCNFFARTVGGLIVASGDPNNIGIIWPAFLNENAGVISRNNKFIGLYDGFWSGEHQRVNGDIVALCRNGFRHRKMTHPLIGDISIERCERMIYVDEGAIHCPMRLILEGEIGAGFVGDPYSPAAVGAGIYNPNGYLRGIVEYSIYNGTDGATLPVDVSSGFVLVNFAARAELAAPIAQFNFDDLSDESGNYDLTGFGSPTFSAGKIGNCINLNGTTQYASNASLPTNGNFSLVGWFNADTDATNLTIASRYGDGGNSWIMFRNSDGSVGIAALGSTTAVAVTASGSTVTGQWYFIAASVNTGTGEVVFRLNDDTPVSDSYTGVLNSSTAPFTFGSQNGNTSERFSGKLDAWRVYNRVLTEEEMGELYNGGNGTED